MARQQLEAGKAQIEEGEAELRKARGQIRDAGEEIEESRQELADARQEVEDGWQEYNDAKAEFDEKIVDAEQKLADARADIADIEKPDTYVLGRETNTGYVCFESDSSIVEGIANVFPVFFFSGGGAGVYDDHEQDGGGAADTDRCLEGARLWRGQDHGEISLLLGQCCFYRLCGGISGGDPTVSAGDLAGLRGDVQVWRYRLCF